MSGIPFITPSIYTCMYNTCPLPHGEIRENWTACGQISHPSILVLVHLNIIIILFSQQRPLGDLLYTRAGSIRSGDKDGRRVKGGRCARAYCIPIYTQSNIWLFRARF